MSDIIQEDQDGEDASSVNQSRQVESPRKYSEADEHEHEDEAGSIKELSKSLSKEEL